MNEGSLTRDSVSPAIDLIENVWAPWAVVSSMQVRSSSAVRLELLKAGERLKIGLRLRSFPFEFRSSGGIEQFRAVGIAGSLSLQSASFEIKPKYLGADDDDAWRECAILIMRILFGKHVASIAARRQKWTPHRLIELIACAFADAVDRGLKDQPIRLYKETQISSSVLQGRINVGRQFQRAATAPHMFECDLDQLDVENKFNDVLKWAASTLSCCSLPSSLRRRLTEQARAIPGEAARSSYYRRQTSVHVPPQYKAWSDALELARMLADGRLLSGLGGKSSGYSFVFNMERAFELLVEKTVSKALYLYNPEGLKLRRQSWARYACSDWQSRDLTCRPDIVLEGAAGVRLIADAKYKRAGTSADSSDQKFRSALSTDMYELMAGLIAHKCATGVLVYPYGLEPIDGSNKVRSWRIATDGFKARVGVLSLNIKNFRSHDSFERACTELARELYEYCSKP